MLNIPPISINFWRNIWIVVVGRDLARQGTVEVRDRRSGERRSVPAAEAAGEIAAVVREALAH